MTPITPITPPAIRLAILLWAGLFYTCAALGDAWAVVRRGGR